MAPTGVALGSRARPTPPTPITGPLAAASPGASGAVAASTVDATRTTIWTIGHGALSTEAIAAALRAAGVRTLVDIRRFPGSRRSPHLARERLAADLSTLEIVYEWAGAALGGRRSPRPGPTRHTAWQDRAFRGYADHTDGPIFRDAVDALVRRAVAGERLAVMCAELDWRRCHRRLVADALTVRGVAVVHLRADRPPEPHEPHPDLQIGADGWPLWAMRGPVRDPGRP